MVLGSQGQLLPEQRINPKLLDASWIENEFVVRALLPGFDKSGISITVKNKALHISAWSGNLYYISGVLATDRWDADVELPERVQTTDECDFKSRCCNGILVITAKPKPRAEDIPQTVPIED